MLVGHTVAVRFEDFDEDTQERRLLKREGVVIAWLPEGVFLKGSDDFEGRVFIPWTRIGEVWDLKANGY